MVTPPKDQIQKLSPEKQEALASFTLSEAKRRTRLLEGARRYRGLTWVPALLPALLMIVFFFGRAKTDPWSEGLVPFVMLMVVWAAGQYQINGINRRLDALLEVLEPDLQSQNAITGPEEAKPPGAAHTG